MNSFGFNGFSGFGIGFSIFPLLFSLFFLVFIGIFVFILAKGISQWNKNNHSPRLIVNAKVVGKRNHVSRHHGTNDMHHTSSSYYVTFEVESGDRMELHVAGHEYGLLIVGDRGRLKFQGTRYLSF